MPDSESQPSRGPAWLNIPEIPRVLPFAVFLIITSLAAGLFPGSEYWLYAVKTLLVASLLWWLRPRLPEMKWAVSPEALGVGVLIAVLWIGLEGRIPTLGQLWDWVKGGFGALPAAKPEEPWNPLQYFAGNPALGWLFVVIRVLGRSLVVPPIEEVFYRGFVYRYLINPKFADVPLSTWNPFAFFVTSALFGLSHPGQWVPGILCGMAYQGLVIRRGRLGDAMVAHAVTNLIISGWAVATGQWQFT